MRNIKLTIEYEGTHYLGWQRQPQGMTVQQALEEAIERVTGVVTSVTGAGRTDARVHARGQVANFRTESKLAVERLQGALNAVLPRDIVVLTAEDVSDDFHSRFSAQSKLYQYTIWNGRVRPALDRKFAWHLRWPLDLERMQEAANLLLGKHDFAGFESANAESNTTVRTVSHASWKREDPSKLIFAIEADAFLYNMVRAIVGTLVDVGRGKVPTQRVAEILESGDRRLAGPTAPPHGLCLMAVRYPPLPSQGADQDGQGRTEN